MLSNHTTSLAQSRKLYELGFRKDYIFFRRKTDDDQRYLCSKLTHNTEEQYDTWAYLLSEIMENFDYDFKIRKESVWFEATLWEHGRYNAKSATHALCDLVLYGLEDWFISTK